MPAHLQVRVARIMMIPGEPIWGLTVTPLQPGTADADHLYALVRQVANNHACPFGRRRLLLTCERGAGEQAPSAHLGNHDDEAAGDGQ